MQNAIDAAQATGLPLFIPSPASEYLITDRLLIDTSTVSVFGTGVDCVIRQATWGVPVFEVRADDVTIAGLYLEFTATRTVISREPADYVDGISARAYCAAIYVADSDRPTLKNIVADGFVSGIFLRGVTAGLGLNEDAYIENLVALNVDQGIVFGQQRGLRLQNLVAYDIARSQTEDATHAVYVLGLPYGNEVYNERCIIDGVSTWNNSGGGHAIQVKYLKESIIRNVAAWNHPGLFLSRNMEYSIIANLKGYELSRPEWGNALFHLSGTERRNLINNIYIENMSDGQIGLNVLGNAATGDSQGNTVWNFTIYDNSASPGNVVNLRGTRNRVINLRLICDGTPRKGFLVKNSSLVTMYNPSVVNGAGSYFFDIEPTAENTTLIYGDEQLDLANPGVYDDNGAWTTIVHN